ncbi:hypothetical protein SAMN05216312_1158 [Cohnella sp. OV330]|nr:hypothetical protein SAMN05216312_1158 [Cohnella sp. OV330]
MAEIALPLERLTELLSAIARRSAPYRTINGTFFRYRLQKRSLS